VDCTNSLVHARTQEERRILVIFGQTAVNVFDAINEFGLFPGVKKASIYPVKRILTSQANVGPST
jgi:hypothetical protein